MGDDDTVKLTTNQLKRIINEELGQVMESGRRYDEMSKEELIKIVQTPNPPSRWGPAAQQLAKLGMPEEDVVALRPKQPKTESENPSTGWTVWSDMESDPDYQFKSDKDFVRWYYDLNSHETELADDYYVAMGDEEPSVMHKHKTAQDLIDAGPAPSSPHDEAPHGEDRPITRDTMKARMGDEWWDRYSHMIPEGKQKMKLTNEQFNRVIKEEIEGYQK